MYVQCQQIDVRLGLVRKRKRKNKRLRQQENKEGVKIGSSRRRRRKDTEEDEEFNSFLQLRRLGVLAPNPLPSALCKREEKEEDESVFVCELNT